MSNKEAIWLMKGNKRISGEKIEKPRIDNMEMPCFNSSPSCLFLKMHHSPHEFFPTLAPGKYLLPLLFKAANAIPSPDTFMGHY